jgi:predicted ArsR family transcriptional regulator
LGTRWDQRFFASTRGQVVTLLRRGRHTVDELASAVGLTDNAVRAHLAALERDGLVKQGSARRGIGKPAFTYNLTSDAERLFPKAYGSVLREIIAVLEQRLTSTELEAVLREAGRRIAANHQIPDNDLRARIDHALAVLGELGGLADREPVSEGIAIQGHDCPLAAVVPGHPEVCRLAQALLEEIIGTPIFVECEQRDPARCRFVVPLASKSPFVPLTGR